MNEEMHDVDDILSDVTVTPTVSLDPAESIDDVTSSMMMSDDYPGTGFAPFEDESKRALVCPEDECHWMPCEECDPTRHQCRFDARHPVHLGNRTGFVYFKKPNNQKASGYVWVTELCRCHPAREG